MTLKNIKYVTRHIIEKGIHLTPIREQNAATAGPNCNHFTQPSFLINVLHVVTRLHRGCFCEN